MKMLGDITSIWTPICYWGAPSTWIWGIALDIHRDIIASKKPHCDSRGIYQMSEDSTTRVFEALAVGPSISVLVCTPSIIVLCYCTLGWAAQLSSGAYGASGCGATLRSMEGILIRGSHINTFNYIDLTCKTCRWGVIHFISLRTPIGPVKTHMPIRWPDTTSKWYLSKVCDK